ncbi:MAG TPA: hypothetical protein VG144_05490 [Gaiellaceae bacterium]|nr:hypothetical protein [Gaiellaceae bacterium]
MGVAPPQAFRVTTAAAGGACVGDAHVITVAGEATRDVPDELELALQSVYEDGGKTVAVDLTGIEPLEPEVLDVVARRLRPFRARGGDIVVACPDEPLTRELRTERRLEDALAALFASERP